MSEIIENFLYLGSLNDACTPYLLNKLKITHLLNLSLTKIIPDENCKILHLPLKDTLDENLYNYIEQTNEFIHLSHEKQNGRCLVFCKYGRSRSVASLFLFSFISFFIYLIYLVVIAYLIYYHEYTLTKAYFYLLKIRPTINPNENYLKQLDKYSSQSEQIRSKSIYS